MKTLLITLLLFFTGFSFLNAQQNVSNTKLNIKSLDAYGIFGISYEHSLGKHISLQPTVGISVDDLFSSNKNSLFSAQTEARYYFKNNSELQQFYSGAIVSFLTENSSGDHTNFLSIGPKLGYQKELVKTVLIDASFGAVYATDFSDEPEREGVLFKDLFDYDGLEMHFTFGIGFLFN